MTHFPDAPYFVYRIPESWKREHNDPRRISDRILGVYAWAGWLTSLYQNPSGDYLVCWCDERAAPGPEWEPTPDAHLGIFAPRYHGMPLEVRKTDPMIPAKNLPRRGKLSTEQENRLQES